MGTTDSGDDVGHSSGDDEGLGDGAGGLEGAARNSIAATRKKGGRAAMIKDLIFLLHETICVA